MKKLLKTSMMILVISLSGITMSAQANTPTESSVKQLMSVTKAADLIEQNLAANNDAMVQSVLTALPQEGMSEEQRQQLAQIISKYNQEIYSSDYIHLVSQQLTSAYINAAQNHFTQEEVDAQIAFYSSDVGQRIINKQPAMIREYMNESMPMVMQTTLAQLQKVMPKLKKEVEAWQDD